MSNNQEFYLFIIFQREKNETDVELKFKDKKAFYILFTEKKQKNDKKEEYRIILRYVISDKKQEVKETKKKIKLTFEIKKDIYDIDFEPKGKRFIYDLNLISKHSFYRTKTEQKQNEVLDLEKLNYFSTALGNEKEELLLKLYEDSINIYGEKPSFPFLINIFAKIYKIPMCSKLLDKFKNKLTNENQKNSVINENLGKFKELFEEISDNSDKIIEKNNFNYTDYNGLILCYLNNYLPNKFEEHFRHIYAKNAQSLFEILLQYKPYFRSEIKFEGKMLEEFIIYGAGLTYSQLTKNALIYIKKYKEFLTIIDNHKDKTIEIEGFEPIKFNELDNKISQDEIDDINTLVNNILEFSKERKKLLVFFSSNFWELLIKVCSNCSQENIQSLNNIKENFQNYLELVKDLYQKKKDVRPKKGSVLEDALKFNEKNKVDSIIDKNIKEFINKKEDITNKEIINLIMYLDPFFKENKEQYLDKRDVNILKRIDFQTIDDEFIKEYQSFNFEIIFKKSIIQYLELLFIKVDNWQKFCFLEALIKDENLDKKKDYIILLNRKYDELINLDIPSELEEKVVETLKNICEFMIINGDGFYSKKIEKLNHI